MTLLEKIAYFVASDKIEGDYLEFGVFRGGTLIEAYQSMSRIFERRISEVGYNATAENASVPGRK